MIARHQLPPDQSKVPTGIAGLDQIACGGLPAGRSTAVVGDTGTGKTVFGLQFLALGILEYAEPGVLVTCEEDPADLLANVSSFGWNLDDCLKDNTLAIVDATPDYDAEAIEVGRYDLAALVARVEAAIKRVGARRVTIDAVGSVFPQFTDATQVRRELHRLAQSMRKLGVTTLITLERTESSSGTTRFGVEEFVADNLILLRNRLDAEKRRRSVEILKLRGAAHFRGEYPFTIDAETGVTLVPLAAIAPNQLASSARVSSGIPGLDRMCEGGFYRDSVVLASGATGTGKTLTVARYVAAAIARDERVLIVGSEESRGQLIRNANAWGVDFEGAESRGLLRIISRYPEAMGLEDHLLYMRREIDQFRPSRIAVDSVSAFSRIASIKAFREFIVGLTSYIKDLGITGLLTNTTPELMGGESVTDAHVSTIADAIILLRYVEIDSRIRRGIAVLKMRGTAHDITIREYTVGKQGMEVGEPIPGVQHILGARGGPKGGY